MVTGLAASGSGGWRSLILARASPRARLAIGGTIRQLWSSAGGSVGVGVEAKRAIEQRWCGARGREVHEHAERVGQPFVAEGDLAVQLDRDAHGVGQHGASNVGDRRDAARPRRALDDSRRLHESR
jgi:hypothetical protein